MAVIKETLTLEDKLSNAMLDALQVCNRMADALDDLRYSAANIETASASAAIGIDRMATSMEEAAQKTDGTTSSGNSLLGTVKQLAGAFASFETAKWLVNTSDQMTQLNARLELMTGSAKAAAAAQEDIYAAAQRSRGAYADMANLVSQLGMLAPEAFSDAAGNLNTGELVVFAEQLQKQMTISGASGESAAAAMVQLTQGLASGTLRGEELNSVLEQTPMIAQTIAEYMGVNTGKMRELASEGAITADVVKNAILSAAEETNAAFEQMPMTWAQVWTQAQTIALQALQPVLDAISWGANNIDTLAPAILGVAAAIGVYTAAMTAKTAADWLAVAANRALVASMLTNPFLWVAVAVGAAVAAIYSWIQAVGGVQVAWLTAVDVVLSGMDNLRIGIYTGMFFLQNKFTEFGVAAQSMGVSVVNFFGDMKVGALENIQGMANEAISIINWMIEQVNKIPGISIDTIDQLTFASTAAAENEAAKAAREASLAKSRAAADAAAAERSATLDQMRQEAYSAHMQRQVGIYNAKLDASGASTADGYALGAIAGYDEITGAIGDVGQDVKGIKKSVDLSNEDLKYMVDLATRRYISNVNLTSQTPVITINGANTGRTKEDREALARAVEMVLWESVAAGSASSIAPHMAFG